MISFKDMGLNPMIMQALDEIGFEKPTEIQSRTIPHLINSENDLVALAQTGTGKTAAFSLPIIQQLDDDDDGVQALILCPTRELAIQIAKDIKEFSKYLPGSTVTPVYGGERIDNQIRNLKKNPKIVVGTPGRVNDMIKRRILKIQDLRWLVLDEADEMLNMGFKEELDTIIESMPEDKQVLLFSATMDSAVRRIANTYMTKPEEIKMENQSKGSDNVQHFYYVVHEKDRYQALRRIADNNTDIHGIVFCRTRRETQLVADKLIEDGYNAEAIHGEVSQQQRTNVMDKFRDKKIQLLVATDVAARGIDVDKLTHVINYNLPDSLEAYVHRSGRTGRAHNLGISLVIVNMRETHKIRSLERATGKTFEKGKIPDGKDICEKQLFKLVDKVCNTEVNEEQIGKYLELIVKKFEDMSREDLIKKFFSIEFNQFLKHYQNASDLNPTGNSDRGERSNRKASILMARFKINVGKSTGLSVKELFRFMNSQPELRSVEIGNIDIGTNHTEFEVDQNFKDKVIHCFESADLNDAAIDITCEKTGIATTRQSNDRPSRPPRRGNSGGGYGGRSRGGSGGGGGRNKRKY